MIGSGSHASAGVGRGAAMPGVPVERGDRRACVKRSGSRPCYGLACCKNLIF